MSVYKDNLAENPFAGEWEDSQGRMIVVAGTYGNLTVVLTNGEGPYQGSYVNYATPVITFAKPDKGALTGILVSVNNTVHVAWNNGEKWTPGICQK